MARRNWLPGASNEARGAELCVRNGSDDDFVAAAQQGEPAAQRWLYEEHRGCVYRLMVRMVGVQDAADVTQQVFLQVLRTIGQFSRRSKFRTWLYRLAVNEALQHLRRKERSKFLPLEHEIVDGSPTHTRRSERVELLEQALSRLDSDLRCVFLLREVDGLPYRDIAVALNVPEGTIGSRLNRARRLLRDHLTELGWQP